MLSKCVKSIVLLICLICTIYHLFIYFSRHRFVLFFYYKKRANKLINSIINSIFDLVICLFFKFTNLIWVFFFLFSSSFKWSLYVYFLLVMPHNCSLDSLYQNFTKRLYDQILKLPTAPSLGHKWNLKFLELIVMAPPSKI